MTPLPTVLVPGLGNDTRKLAWLAHTMRRADLQPSSMSPQPSSGKLALEILAGDLANMIEERFGPNQPLNLFGFSMGGLICRYFIQVLGGAARTRRLVTLATPHRGTWTAHLFPGRPACIQMRPGSPFLCALNRDLAQLQQLAFVSIWTPFDLTVLPQTSSCLPVGKSVRVFSPFHATLLYDPRVLRTVTGFLL